MRMPILVRPRVLVLALVTISVTAAVSSAQTQPTRAFIEPVTGWCYPTCIVCNCTMLPPVIIT